MRKRIASGQIIDVPRKPKVNYVERRGLQEWYMDGNLHREDAPARIINGLHEWYIHGQLHRVGGPAVYYTKGIFPNLQAWYIHGQRHRDDRGPAVIYQDELLQEQPYEEWWYSGKKHNMYGPAVIWPDNSVEWWLNDKHCYSVDSWIRELERLEPKHAALMKLKWMIKFH